MNEFMVYARDGNLNKIKELINSADINFQSYAGLTALMYACKNNHINIVKYLIDQGKANVNILNMSRKTVDSGTALIYACKFNRFEIVKILIKSGADVNLHGYDGTALNKAVYNGHIPIVKYLVQNGADVNIIHKYSYGPFYLMHNFKVSKYLLKNGIKIKPLINTSNFLKNIVLKRLKLL